MHFDFVFCYILVILVVLILVLASFFCHYRSCCRRNARNRVKSQSDGEKLREINQALEPFGFAYSMPKDIFYSLEDAWQRQFGYGRLYDELAPAMNMLIDCEPIYFAHGGRRWLIEFWKGQYGITTGAEVGIYVDDGENEGKDPEDIFYQSVSPKEQLPISILLYKNGKPLFQRSQNHWWLTGFVLGEFSYPGELMLEVSLSFEDLEMMGAFLEGCYRTGYREEDLHVCYDTVSFCLCRPKNAPSHHCRKFCRSRIQWQNRLHCRLYAHLTKGFERTVDRLYYLMLAYPHLMRLITGAGRLAWGKRQRKCSKRYGQKKKCRKRKCKDGGSCREKEGKRMPRECQKGRRR
ncbi:MAG: DUF4474 domain-containing protein [Lachnospiraceae bacterium]|nr:DUF4474 domain-containing protein [Lachnospiraceae bacterium]